MTNVLAINLDFETIFYLVFVVAAIVGPVLEARKRKKAKATKSEKTPAPATPLTPARTTAQTDAGYVEIKLPTGQVIARIPHDRLERRPETAPRPAPPTPAPAPRTIARPAQGPPPRGHERKARPAPPRPKRDSKAVGLRSHHLSEQDLTQIDQSRTLGALARGDLQKSRVSIAKRRRSDINLRQAVIWSEIFRPPVALRDSNDRLVW